MSLLQRILPPLVLLQWGGVITYFGLSGRMASFLHPNFRIFAAISGVLLIVTAAIVAFASEEEGCEHSHDQCCGHDHEHDEEAHGHSHSAFGPGRWLAFAILIFPIGVAAMVSPDRFSATLVEKRGVADSAASLPGVVERYEEKKNPASLSAAEAAAAADLENPYLKPNAAGNIEAEVIDLMYASEDPIIQKDYAGKKVELIGQFLSNGGKEAGPNSFKLLRLFMICCATDVQPLAVVVESDQELPDVGSMSWVKVAGVVSFEPQGAKYTAKIKASSVIPIEAPAEQYVY